jgi:PPOX class probable F420-dependent enzyme
MTNPLESLARRRNVVLTTYKRDGSAVATTVHLAVVDGRAYVRTYGKAWKWRRVRRTPDCELAEVRVRGRILEGEEAAAAANALGRKYRILHGLLIPRVHRLMRTPTIHMEFVPRQNQSSRLT